MRAGVITTQAMQGDNRVKSESIRKGEYVSFIHNGHPHQLEKSHNLMKK
jgi:hypothetical protein